ncbi:hypothetical protein [Nonomuraea typhae]|uniref:Uncharacterized protein n=1 Tax=Nonomuraea typhae TaxID=2603600 RepID=A0ABW7YJA7_9ACTN
MRTIPRNASKKIAEIRQLVSAEWLIEFSQTGDFPHHTYKVNRAGLTVEDAFRLLHEHKEARLIEHVPGKVYTVTYGGTPRVRQDRVITLIKHPGITRGMKGITYNRPDGTTTCANVEHMWIQLDSDGVPQVMAEIDLDNGLPEFSVLAEWLSPERYVWVPPASYLAEQDAIEAAKTRADQEREEEETCRDCAVPLGTNARDGRCGKCANQSDADFETDQVSETAGPYKPCTDELADDTEMEQVPCLDCAVRPGDTAEVAGTLVTVVRRLYLGTRLIIMCQYKDSQGFEKFGIADFGSVSQPSIVAWGESKQAAKVRFIEWTETVRRMLVPDAGNLAESASEYIQAVHMAYVPMRCVCVWWFPEGSESAYLTKIMPECAVHSDKSAQEASGNAPGLTLTESAVRELRELVKSWRQAVTPTREWEVGTELVIAIEALLEQKSTA